MEKLWTGRSAGALDEFADKLNSSIGVDSRMYKEDIAGSIAHAGMLAKCGIITPAEGAEIIEGLGGILADLESGALTIDPAAEDIHSFVETELTARIGDAGKKLHTARSRNDQVALDTRLYLKGECEKTAALIKDVISALCHVAEANEQTIMPGYTHLQRAQPVTLAHHLLAYGMMLARDIGRLEDAKARMMSACPLGSAALAGTTHPIDRAMTAAELGFDGYCLNSMDGVSDRDYCVELCAALSVLMMHLSRLSEELILWSSWEFKFIELSDQFTTGSSIMPQKKNSDMAELVRGKTGRVYGDLTTLLVMLKGLPLAYNKDMQEDKEAVFDAFDTASDDEGERGQYALRGQGRVHKRHRPRRLPREEGRALPHGLQADGPDCRGLREERQGARGFDARGVQGLFGGVRGGPLRGNLAPNLRRQVAKRVSAGGAAPANIAAQLEYLRGVSDD